MYSTYTIIQHKIISSFHNCVSLFSAYRTGKEVLHKSRETEAATLNRTFVLENHQFMIKTISSDEKHKMEHNIIIYIRHSQWVGSYCKVVYKT